MTKVEGMHSSHRTDDHGTWKIAYSQSDNYPTQGKRYVPTTGCERGSLFARASAGVISIP